MPQPLKLAIELAIENWIESNREEASLPGFNPADFVRDAYEEALLQRELALDALTKQFQQLRCAATEMARLTADLQMTKRELVTAVASASPLEILRREGEPPDRFHERRRAEWEERARVALHAAPEATKEQLMEKVGCSKRVLESLDAFKCSRSPAFKKLASSKRRTESISPRTMDSLASLRQAIREAPAVSGTYR